MDLYAVLQNLHHHLSDRWLAEHGRPRSTSGRALLAPVCQGASDSEIRAEAEALQLLLCQRR
jgi:hypothetical protein